MLWHTHTYIHTYLIKEHPVVLSRSGVTQVLITLQEGVSAAHYAAKNGHVAVVKFLVEECHYGQEEETIVCVFVCACVC